MRIVEVPYPADAEPGGLLPIDGVAYGGICRDYLLARVEDTEEMSLSALRSFVTRTLLEWTRAPEWEPDDPRRVSIMAVPGDSNLFLRELQESGGWSLGDELFERPPTSPFVYVEGDRIFVTFSLRLFEKPDAGKAHARLRTFLQRHDAVATINVGRMDVFRGGGFELEVVIEREFPRGTSLADARRFGEEARALVELVDGDEIPRALVMDLLCAGRWGVFKGQPESDWLEAKGAPYADANRRLGKNWKYELAKDVAAFANSLEGGIIVIGMTTMDEGDGEVITGFKEFDLKRVTTNSYGNHVARHIHPRVEGFEVVRVPGREKERGIAVLIIPPQDPSNFPFLVRGVVSNGEVLGSHVLWPVRQGDQTAILDADGLHARLRLGDQAIRRSE